MTATRWDWPDRIEKGLFHNTSNRQEHIGGYIVSTQCPTAYFMSVDPTNDWTFTYSVPFSSAKMLNVNDVLSGLVRRTESSWMIGIVQDHLGAIGSAWICLEIISCERLWSVWKIFNVEENFQNWSITTKVTKFASSFVLSFSTKLVHVINHACTQQVCSTFRL